MLVVTRDSRESPVIGPGSHVISAASIHDASGIFYLVVSGRVWPVLLPAGVSRHVRYGSACGFSPRSPSFRLVGWFLGPGPARPFIGAWMIPGIFGRKCICFYDVYPVFSSVIVSKLRGRVMNVVFALYIVLRRIPLCVLGM